jgi:glycosyltransferase involved in cell wall biosynthesis
MTARLALFVPSLGGGGAERNMVRLANGLATRGYAVDLVAATAEGPNREAIAPAVTLVDLASPRVGRAIGPLSSYLRRARPAVLLSSHEHGNVAALLARALARTGTPLVLTLRSTLSAQARRAGDWRDRWLLPALARILYPSASQIVALSQGAASDAESWLALPRGTVRVIPNPVLSPALGMLAAEEVSGDPVPATHLVLATGRLVYEKDFGTLLEAFALVHAREPRARLVILGEGPQRSRLEEQRHQLGLDDSVQFPGFAANPYAWMSRASVFVLSSLYEGLPTVLIEALACGAHVVATDCPSGPREILADGRLGALVPVGDAPAMAQAIVGALARPRQRVSAAELAPYSEERVIEAWVRLLQEPGVGAA